ncbi:hypothetical protein BD779DRAFT_251819 [Infundibulicybe gibba]|nr:hypothetical protein BD779DRAFT_251819 [Infundibulicybe gibba]
MTLRVYALYGRSSRVLGGMVIILVFLVVLGCWKLFASQESGAIAPQTLGCQGAPSRDTSMRLAVAWESMFAYDSMIFVLTLAKTWREGRKIKISGTRQLPMITLLLRDGAIYFAVTALANLANILTFYYLGPFLRGGLSHSRIASRLQ